MSGLAALGCGGSWLPLKLLFWWLDRAGEYPFLGQKHPLHLWRSLLVVIKWIPNSPWIRHGQQKPCHFLIFLHRPLHLIWMDWSSSFNLQLIFLCQWLPDQVTWTIRSLELPPRWRAKPSHHQMAEMALKRQEASGRTPSHSHPSPWWGG